MASNLARFCAMLSAIVHSVAVFALRGAGCGCARLRERERLAIEGIREEMQVQSEEGRGRYKYYPSCGTRRPALSAELKPQLSRRKRQTIVLAIASYSTIPRRLQPLRARNAPIVVFFCNTPRNKNA